MERLIVIKDCHELATLTDYLKDKEYVAFDTETTGIGSDAEIIGLSLCAEPGIGYYIITAAWSSQEQRLIYYPTKERMPELLQILSTKSLIMHNGLFDCNMVQNNYKVNLICALHTDTMILAHLLDENRRVGLKELGSAYYGASARKEQEEMKASILANGGEMTKAKYELYKADAELIANYGAKDAILTYNLFYEMVPELDKENLLSFFYNEECMPLLRGPTYQLNTEGLRVDVDRLNILKSKLEVEILSLREFIYREIASLTADKYPGTSKRTQFNISSNNQIAWLLFEKLGNTFPKLSDTGRELIKMMNWRTPYSKEEKLAFVAEVRSMKGSAWREAGTMWDPKLRRYKGKAAVKDYWTYFSADKFTLAAFAKKYKWTEKLLEYKKLSKMLSTYVNGINAATKYGIIHPSFLQHGTTSGRYSSRKPNFQNLPRDDKRVKECIMSRPGKNFVGADYSQLEPRVFAAFSGDERLLKCFKDGEDFYSVIGAEVFEKYGYSLRKDDENSFAKKYPELRQIAKGIALSATYGTTANKMAHTLEKPREECQHIIDSYFAKFPKVKQLMLESHEQAKREGKVFNLYGRPRRMPDAMKIRRLYGNLSHDELPYEARNLLNLSINHRIQSTGASIINRAAIQFLELCKEVCIDAKIVLQVHDELVAECLAKDAEDVAILLKHAMENAAELPGITLIAEPKIANNLADLK